jgi:DNA-binding transcriptional ArsR family regulator
MVRHMPKRSSSVGEEGEWLAEIFQALAAPTRLAVVERLSIGPASTTELARPFEMALPSFLQHLTVLERVGIVSSQKTGRTRVYQLAPDALRRAADWLGTNRNHWERRLDQLDALLVGPQPEPSPPNPVNP